MFHLPQSWRRSIRSALAAGCLLWGSSAWALDRTVTSAADSGANTLRQAILDINAAGQPANNIIINVPVTIATPLPAIASNVAITSGGAPVALSGGGTNRIFYVNSGNVTISNLNLTNGRALGGTGGTGRGGGGGGLGAGGAIYVNSGANVTVSGVTFGAANATGGTGGTGSGGAALAGGGGGGLGGNGGSAAAVNAGGGGGGLRGNGGSGALFGGGGGGGQGGGVGTQVGNGGNGNVLGGGGGGGNLANGANAGIGAGGLGGGGGGNGASIIGVGGAGGPGGGGGGGAALGAGGAGGSNGGGGGGSLNPGGAGGAHGGGGGGGAAFNGGTAGYGGGGGGAGLAGVAGAAGFGGGAGGAGGVGNGGNGGSAFGGLVFVQAGGTLTVVDSNVPAGNTLTFGPGGGGGVAGLPGATAGRAGFIDTGSTINFVASGTQLLADELAGPGGVNKAGAGILNVTSANVYTGPTNVQAGTLNVNGAIVSAVNVLGPGILSGTGNVGPTTVNGAIAPGNSIGTLTVNGPYVQNPGSRYNVEINPAGQSDRIAVNGTARINGGIVQVLAQAGVYRSGTTYTILTATAGVSGRYDSAQGMIPGFFLAQLIYNPNNILLVLGRTNFQAAALTFNQSQVAQYLDANPAPAGNDLEQVVNALQTLTPAQLPNALDQISGVEYPGLMTAGRLRSLYLHQLLGQEIRPDLSGIVVPNDVVARGAAPDDDCPKVEFAPGWRSWARFYGLGGNVAGDTNAAGFDYSFAGFLLGVERQIGCASRVGVFGGYNRTRIDFERVNGSADADGLLGGIYGVQEFGPTYVLGSAAYGYNSFDVTRQIAFANINRIATGSPDQHEFDGYVEAGVHLSLGRIILQPMLGLQYLSLQQTAIAETGADSLNRVIGDESASALWFMPGLRIARAFNCSEHMITPTFHARWVYDMTGEDRLISGSLSNVGGAFETEGAAAGRNFLVTGLTVSVSRGPRVRLLGDYTILTSNKQTAHSGSGGVEIRW